MAHIDGSENIGKFDSRYLKLDCSNDPLTAQLEIRSASVQQLIVAFDVSNNSWIEVDGAGDTTIDCSGGNISFDSSNLTTTGNITINADFDTGKFIFGAGGDGEIFVANNLLTIENTTQDFGISFKVNDGSVAKIIIWDAASDTLTHSAGTFNFSDDNLITSGNISVDSDSNKLRLGADQDFDIFHDGSDGYIDCNTGDLYISTVGAEIRPLNNIFLTAATEIQFRASTSKIYSSSASILAIESPILTFAATLLSLGDGSQENVFLNFATSGEGGFIGMYGTANYLATNDSFAILADSKGFSVGVGQDGQFYSDGDDVYLQNVTSDADLFIQATDGEVIKTFIGIDASEAIISIGQVGDITIGDGTLRVMRPHTTLKIDLGTSSYKFNDAHIGNDLTVGNDLAVTGDTTVGGDMIATGKVIGEAYYHKITARDGVSLHAYSNIRPATVDGAKFYTTYTPFHYTFFVNIPKGYKATKVKINGEDATNTITVYECLITDGTTATSKGTGNVNTEIDITDVSHTDTNYLTIAVLAAASTTDEIYGGYVYMEPDI